MMNDLNPFAHPEPRLPVESKSRRARLRRFLLKDGTSDRKQGDWLEEQTNKLEDAHDTTGSHPVISKPSCSGDMVTTDFHGDVMKVPQRTSSTTHRSWRTKSVSAERERDNTVKQLEHDDTTTDHPARDMFSTDRGKHDARAGQGSPLYPSKSLGRNDKFRYSSTNQFSRETSRETRRDHSESRASDPAISRSFIEFEGQRKPEDLGKPESALHSTIVEPSTQASGKFDAVTDEGKWNGLRKDESTPLITISTPTAEAFTDPVTSYGEQKDLWKHDLASHPSSEVKAAGSPPQTSFKPGKKSRLHLFKVKTQRHKTPPDLTSLSNQKFAKPSGSATTSVPLAIEDLSQDQIIIAVMGPTGSGKSSFIGAATNSDVGVGHELQSCTTEINMVKLNYLDSSRITDFDVVFVDTPGFDDTNKTDVEILEMLADWLNKTYQSKIILAGILYFHRISDNRMAGTPLKNLRMFRELCGKRALENIILVTTMWDEVDKDVGSQREKELRGKYWKAMIDQGSATARYNGTPESAWDIVEHFTTQRHAVLLQREMVDLKKELPETAAGQELYTTLELLVKRQQVVLEKIHAETKRHKHEQDQTILKALQAECEGIRRQLDTTLKEMQSLKLSLGQRLHRLLSSPVGSMR